MTDGCRALALVLGTHALVLDDSRRAVVELRDRLALMTGEPPPGELAEIGRVFRREADSAVDVARAAEKAAGG